MALTSASASVEIPANRRLAGNWAYEAQTRHATRVDASIDQRGIRVSVSPGIHLDVTWPGRDCTINGASLAFGPAAPRVDVSDGGGVGVIPVDGTVEAKISEMLARGVAGTRLRDPHYDPLHDPDLSGTVQQVAQSFARCFASPGAPRAGGVGLGDVTGRGLGAGFTVTEPIHIAEDVDLAAGGQVQLEALGAANLGALAAARDNPGRADAIHFDALQLTSPGLDINVGGKPLVRMQQLTFHRGGRVSVEAMTPLGKLASARRTEAGLAGIAALIMLAAGDQSALALAEHAQNPRIVDAVAAATIERKLEAALRGLVLQHRNAIAGVDLATALGIR